MQLGLMHFGDESEKPQPDFDLARHTIDLMAILQEKTKGNLTLEEQRLLENSLTELRFRYVQAVEESKKSQEWAWQAQLKITVLGSGTSVGVPTIGCHCDVCTSTDPRDNRLRPSILVQYGGRNVLIDTTPDFRTQALRAGSIGWTPSCSPTRTPTTSWASTTCAPSTSGRRARIPIFASADTMAAIRRCFHYIFDREEHGILAFRNWNRIR